MKGTDELDRALLYELDKNSRASFARLGQVLGIAPETARYRVNRLSELGFVYRFCTVVDSAKMGFAYYKVFLKLHNVDERTVQKIILYLEEHPIIAWLVRIDGLFDIGFAVKAANIHNILELSTLVDSVTARYDCFVNRRVFCVNIAGEYLTRDYFIGRVHKGRAKGFYSVYSSPVAVDETNVAIIKKLTEHSRGTAVEIASHLTITPDAVLLRIKQLEQQKIITRYNVVLNHLALRQIQYKVLIYLNQISPEKEAEFLAYCKTMLHIVFVLKTFGEWNCEIDIEVQDVTQFRAVMMELTSEYAQIIRHYEPLMISQIHKYNLFP